MAASHLVRFGAMGLVGRFASVDAARYPRHSRVVVRSRRGLEIGEILSPVDPEATSEEGSILRGMTIEDELLQARLARTRQQALDSCVELLTERNLPATLLDVEQLFDGSSLLFYFLGDVPAEVETLTSELAEAYEAKAQTRRFAETLTEGCGPGCGTEAATGGGCTTCSTCAVVGACSTKKKIAS
jgi:cell fate regulator YaaT (PSP1 superfamily)